MEEEPDTGARFSGPGIAVLRIRTDQRRVTWGTKWKSRVSNVQLAQIAEFVRQIEPWYI